MNITDIKYRQFALIKEMLETSQLVWNFKHDFSEQLISDIKNSNGIFIAGEGSSRIFPAKNMIHQSLLSSKTTNIVSEGAMQSQDYNLDDYIVFGISNSGKTKEVINLFTKLAANQHPHKIGVACHKNTPLQSLSDEFHFLNCGEERAVAATKSVIYQALFFDFLLCKINNEILPNTKSLAIDLNTVLNQTIEPSIVSMLTSARTLYFSGRNDGVGEELALKTNEITRQQSGFLPGTYLLHGIEEVISTNDALILIEPFAEECEKIEKIYSNEIGINVIAISSKPTRFPTILLPNSNPKTLGYLALAAGWNLLVETGISLDINLDKPIRARKIGNEFSSLEAI
jgi:glutamine---fructose-6-phosphate transaminase (isomerizing)